MNRKIAKHSISICFLILIGTVGSFAQDADYYLGRNRYDFIDYHANRFDYTADNIDFDEIYTKLDSLIIYGTGKLQVLHLGGSHIQGDIYTHLMRKRMQTISIGMNGGRGLIFPYKMAGTNNPSNFRIKYTGHWVMSKSTRSERSCELGITGMAVTTSDSLARVFINPNADSTIRYDFTSLRIYHEPCNYVLSAFSKGIIYNGTYNREMGCTLISFNQPAETIILNICRDSLTGKFSLLGISLDSDAPGVVYNTVGVNGATLSSYLSCSLYKKHLRLLTPDLIIFSIGTNDAYTRRFDEEKYLSEYRQLLDSTIEVRPNAAILLTVPNDSYLYRRYINGNTAKMRDIIIELAKEYHCGVWDFYTIMGGLNSCQKWYALNLMQPDRVHFTKTGYLLKGELFFSAFLKDWESRL